LGRSDDNGTHESCGIGAIEAEDFDRRCGAAGGFGSLRIAASGSEREAWSCHEGSSGDLTGEHGVDVGVESSK
jgi:hypothetical protein